MSANLKQGDMVRRKDGTMLGTVTHVYEAGSDGTVLADWKSCGRYYTTSVNALELVPADWKPRWRQ